MVDSDAGVAAKWRPTKCAVSLQAGRQRQAQVNRTPVNLVHWAPNCRGRQGQCRHAWGTLYSAHLTRQACMAALQGGAAAPVLRHCRQVCRPCLRKCLCIVWGGRCAGRNGQKSIKNPTAGYLFIFLLRVQGPLRFKIQGHGRDPPIIPHFWHPLVSPSEQPARRNAPRPPSPNRQSESRAHRILRRPPCHDAWDGLTSMPANLPFKLFDSSKDFEGPRGDAEAKVA